MGQGFTFIIRNSRVSLHIFMFTGERDLIIFKKFIHQIFFLHILVVPACKTLGRLEIRTRTIFCSLFVD